MSTTVFSFEQDGTALTVRIDGSLDIESSPKLEEELAERLDGVELLTLDFSGVAYVSSMGLRLLLRLQKRMVKQGSLLVVNVCDDVMELFEETGFADIIAIDRGCFKEEGC